MLVIDGVVLVAFDQPQQVRDLDADPAGVGNQRAQSLAEVDDVGNMCEHIVGDNEVGLAVPVGDITTGLLAEEHHLGVDALAPSDLGNVGRRLDPERSDAARDAVLQQVAVVARHLDDKGLYVRARAADRGVVDEPAGMGHPGVRIRGEVGVVGEDILRRDVGGQLDQQAVLADAYVQGVERLGPSS